MMSPIAPPTTARAAPTVVLVDDDDALRQALRFSLEIEGYNIEACRTGEELLTVELPEDAACLIIDYRLAGLSGADALEELRRRGVTLPAILITSYANPLLRARARRAKAEVVEKPLVGDALLGRIHEILPLSPEAHRPPPSHP
jgi:FixJ family two-component response regulator